VSRPRSIDVTTYADGSGLWHADVLATPERIAQLDKMYTPRGVTTQLDLWAWKTARRRIEIELRQRAATPSDPFPKVRFKLEHTGTEHRDADPEGSLRLMFKEV